MINTFEYRKCDVCNLSDVSNNILRITIHELYRNRYHEETGYIGKGKMSICRKCLKERINYECKTQAQESEI